MQTDSEKTSPDSLLSRWLDREKKDEGPKGTEPRPEGVKIPLSLGQQRLLFLQQLYPENPFYHHAEAYKFKGTLDLEKILKSFELVAERHECLRTSFVFENGKAFQQINEKPLFEVLEHDLRDVSDTEIKKAANEIAVREARKSFDLSRGILTRIAVLRIKDDELILVLVINHMIGDRWSMRILQTELAGHYRKLSDGKETEVAPLEIQYADYAYWQNQHKTDEKTVNYWTNKLENSLTFLDLPTDLRRPVSPTFRGATATKTLSADLSTRIKKFCKDTKKTLFVVMLTAYKILLSKYSGETDILVGSPFTNRDEVALEKIIGFFNDTLVLRSDLSDDPTFNELLEQVWETTQEAFVHKNMPFEALVKNLQPKRYLNHNPLFQVMFIYNEEIKLPDFGEGLDIQQEQLDFGVTKFDLTLFVSEKEENLTISIEYAKDLFEEKTVRRMQQHFENLLEGIIQNPNEKISALSIITPKETDLINEWNSTEVKEKEVRSVVHLFTEQVHSNPEKKAVSFKNESLTYRELNERANSIANYLINLDLDREKPVGLLVEQSIGMVCGIFGILKAGLAYLPLDAGYPRERIKFALEDSGASALITEDSLFSLVEDEFSDIHTIEKILSASPVTEPTLKRDIEKNDLAYVIYTSGSTGRPKGVSVTHENLFYSTSARFDYYENEPQNFLLLSSFSFDSSVAGIFWTLTTGGNLVVAKRRIEQDVKELSEIIKNENITHTLILPTLYSVLLENIPVGQMKSFEMVIVAGEACPVTLCQKHFEKLPAVRLYNEYGPTEATVWATAHQVRPEDITKGLIPIGKPIANSKIHLLDKNLLPVPIGIKGEICIGGMGITEGYLNNSDLSAKFYIENPLSDKEKTDADRIYRTGDLGRYRSDGTIEFSGRIDDQVKIRGYRIEPGEVQEVIKSHPKIQDAVVKLESSSGKQTDSNEKPTDSLSERLHSLGFKEADKLLRSVENLSESEVEFILRELAGE